MKYILIITALVTTLGCTDQKRKVKETPLITVIQLQAAEANLNFKEAKKYIDIDEVFKKHAGSENPEKEWKEMVSFFYNIGNTKKFTNQFKYYNYNITETINNQTADVIFSSKNRTSRIKKIIYSLKNIDDRWRVINIQYIN